MTLQAKSQSSVLSFSSEMIGNSGSDVSSRYEDKPLEKYNYCLLGKIFWRLFVEGCVIIFENIPNLDVVA